MEQVKFKKLSEGARLPERKTKGAAGYDLYAPKDTVVMPGRNVIKLGFAARLPKGWFATIKARSGFSVKGFYDENGCGRYDADVIAGTLDEDYSNEIGVIIKSFEHAPFIIKKGTRIAQMIFQRYEAPELTEVEQLEETERNGGFGSTGVK